MKRILTIFILVLSINACSSAWFEQFAKDPVAQVTALENVVHTTLATALMVWGQLKPTLPIETQAAVQQRIDQAQSVVEHSLTALHDAVQAAVDVKSNSPDLTKVVNDVIDAVNNLVAIVDEFKTKALTATVSGNAYNDMRASQKALERFRRK